MKVHLHFPCTYLTPQEAEIWKWIAMKWLRLSDADKDLDKRVTRVGGAYTYCATTVNSLGISRLTPV